MAEPPGLAGAMVAFVELVHASQVALIEKVTVAVYVPVEYCGSSVRVQFTEPLLPALADRAFAPNVPTGVLDVVLAVCDPVQAVPRPVRLQV